MARPLMSKHRLDALVDAVLAITMTLLVLELGLPENGGADLLAALDELTPKIISWVVSFLILAQFWRGQMQATRGLEEIDVPLFHIMVVWLLLTSVIPFTSSLIGEHNSNPQSHVLYAANLILIEAVVAVRNVYLKRHAALFSGGDTGQAKLDFSATIAITLAALASVATATLIAPDYASIAYVLILPINWLLERLGLD
ncbi:MAG TPA: DUF1211 domain-containing protein [Rhizobiales bacterium]|nr:DUF1211 domain-containing protein [Hyphomicrobiales bacterium]